jgi:hypothetical protein
MRKLNRAALSFALVILDRNTDDCTR